MLKHPFFKSFFFQWVIPFSILALAVISIIYFYYYAKDQMENNSRYTIATTTKIAYRHDGAKYLSYNFVVNNVKIYASTRVREAKVPGRYFVKFSKNSPKLVHEIYQNKPVPDHITEAPPEGWEEIPR